MADEFNIIQCINCGTRVLPMTDGKCPQCGKILCAGSDTSQSTNQPVAEPSLSVLPEIPTVTFGTMKLYKFRCFWHMGYPLLGLGGIAAMYLFVVRDSDSVQLKYAEWMPLIIPALLAWLGWEIYKVVRAFKFKVCINNSGIEVGDTKLAWQQICSVEFPVGIDWQPCIILFGQGVTIRIPAGAEATEYMATIIKQRAINATKA